MWFVIWCSGDYYKRQIEAKHFNDVEIICNKNRKTEQNTLIKFSVFDDVDDDVSRS